MPKRRARLTPPRKQKAAASPATSRSRSLPAAAARLTEGDVQWAAVQADEAAERLKAAGAAMLLAQKELADRTLLATKLSEARDANTSAAKMSELAEQRCAEAAQRQRDVAIAKEHAKQAVKRKQEAEDSLRSVRATASEAMEAVAELRSTLFSDSGSDA